jgi:hypothetical protein
MCDVNVFSVYYLQDLRISEHKMVLYLLWLGPDLNQKHFGVVRKFIAPNAFVYAPVEPLST